MIAGFFADAQNDKTSVHEEKGTQNDGDSIACARRVFDCLCGNLKHIRMCVSKPAFQRMKSPQTLFEFAGFFQSIVFADLFGTQCNDRILLCGESGRNQSRDERQQHTDQNENDTALPWKHRFNTGNSGTGLTDDVDWNT